MICSDCKNKIHENCRGGTWCDCQHKKGRPYFAGISEEVLKELNNGQ